MDYITKISKLSISDNLFRDSILSKVSEKITKYKHLDSLIFYRCSFTCKGFSDLCRALPYLSLKHIEINADRIGNDGVIELFNVFSKLTNLQELLLINIGMTEKCMYDFEKNISYLKKLSIILVNGNNLGETGCNILLRSIYKMKNISKLSCRCMFIYKYICL